MWTFEPDINYSWMFFESVFTEEECDDIINLGRKNGLHSAEIFEESGNHNTDKNYRNCQISWINSTEDCHWIYQKLTQVVIECNEQNFKYDLFGFGEDLQYAEYGGESNNGFYKKHVDTVSNGMVRKLSVVVQLTGPNEYKGGELKLYYTDEAEKGLPKERGSVIVFPSYVLHEVTPVIDGTRQSLVGWVTGKRFI